MSDIKGVEIHDVFGLDKPLTKLIETVSGAIGKIYEPIHKRKMANATAEEIRIIGQTLNEAISLPITYSNGSITIDTSDYKSLVQRAGNRLLYQEAIKQDNIENIINYAYEELKQEENITSEPVDEDWTIRFFNCVEDISNEEMQKIWAKILAGEIKQPNTFSLRTLNIMKNLSQKEAKLFQKLSGFVFFNFGGMYFIISSGNLLSKYNLAYSELLELEECGLIVINHSTVLGLDFENTIQEKMFNNKILGLFTKSDEQIKKDINLRVYKITQAGVDLYNIIEKKPDIQYAIDLFKTLKQEANGYSVSAHEIKSINDINIDYNVADLLLE